jgi:hypothetical protein
MIDWIKKTIDPPGIEKPNRYVLFSVVGEVMARVRKDAEKAFYAHFPYLADDKKLDEHGEALLIPHLLNDTPEEYRNRVATASFFLMRAGERAYIMEQLNQRFGDRFVIDEKFLSIHTKVTELTDDEQAWILSLFDSLVDPNIFLQVSELYNFIDKFLIEEAMVALHGKIQIPYDSIGDSFLVYRNGVHRRNGKAWRQVNTIYIEEFFYKIINNFIDRSLGLRFHNGLFKRNGTARRGFIDDLSTEYSSLKAAADATETVEMAEIIPISFKNERTEWFEMEFRRNNVYQRNGIKRHQNSAIQEEITAHGKNNAQEQLAGLAFRNSQYCRNGKIKHNFAG